RAVGAHGGAAVERDEGVALETGCRVAVGEEVALVGPDAVVAVDGGAVDELAVVADAHRELGAGEGVGGGLAVEPDRGVAEPDAVVALYVDAEADLGVAVGEQRGLDGGDGTSAAAGERDRLPLDDDLRDAQGVLGREARREEEGEGAQEDAAYRV